MLEPGTEALRTIWFSPLCTGNIYIYNTREKPTCGKIMVSSLVLKNKETSLYPGLFSKVDVTLSLELQHASMTSATEIMHQLLNQERESWLGQYLGKQIRQVVL